MARFKRNQYIPPDAPLLYEDHGRPMSRRQFIRQGLMTGSASILSGGIFGLFANPNAAYAAIAGDLGALATEITNKGNFNCSVGPLAAGQKIPFICFDLAGGANLAGSNVLVGQGGGQKDFLSTAGYSKLGIPGDMVPGLDDTGVTLLNPSDGDFTNSELNLVFHADSAMLRGIRDTAVTAFAGGNVDGCVIPARSDNDTANNPHNPLYGLAMTGARGDVVDLIGSRTSVSGGNSMAPASQINPEFRPTKVDRPSDVTGMVDIGDLTAILGADDVTAVMESIARVTHRKLQLANVDTLLGPSRDEIVKDMVRCGYLKSADIADRFAGVPVDPLADINIQSIFSTVGGLADSEFRKAASVMKMVVNGYAAGGCITMGGYDYHTGDRRTGENRDLRAGRCIGACLEYARLLNTKLMIYVFSDGSVFSNGNPDDSANAGTGAGLQLGGAGKGQWTGDNSSTACSFFLVFDPDGPPTLVGSRQIGLMNAGASVVTTATPAANNPNLLVNMLLLNFMAVNGPSIGFPDVISEFKSIFPNHGLGNDASLASYIAFAPL
ncbi:MAG: general secretion pathway protein GspF [Gammaproteobacteria bacterium]|jgi:hypothetical protein|nr:general secretion pathway protein GspF [Gammaproteobacteria bacterium]